MNEHYSEIVIRFGTGQADRKFVTCVTEEAINADFESSKSISREYFPKIQKTDSDFIKTGAWVLGRAECESLCARNHEFANDRHGVIKDGKHKILFETPQNLGVPTVWESGRPKGITLWVVN